MKVRVQPMAGAEPMMCSVNVKKRIRVMGGSPVYGWAIRDLPSEPCIMKYSHVVWQSPDGELLDVTPVIVETVGDLLISEWPEYTEFEGDYAAAFEDKSLGTRYIPRLPEYAQACEWMNRADALMFAGNLTGCRYWTAKANQSIRRAGWLGQWDVPVSLDLADVIQTMYSQ